MITVEQTRRILCLVVKPPTNVSKIMEQLDFKGCVRIMFPTTTQIQDIFGENRSVICCNPPKDEGLSSKIHYIPLDSTNPIEQFQAYCHEHHLGIGDHKKDASGSNGAPTAGHCYYCEYVRYNYYDPHRKMLRTYYRSKNFFCMPTLGAFINGYTVIIPNEHAFSNACLSRELQEEFYEVLEDVKYILKLTYPHYKDFLVWENGTGNGGRGKAKSSVVHSHVHVAPSYLSASKIAEEYDLSFESVDDAQLSKFNQVSYLAIRDKVNTSWNVINSSNIFIPRQFVRQILGNEHGLTGEKWNWRLYPCVDIIAQTMTDIQSSLVENWDRLPERIKERTECFLPGHYILP